MIAFVGRQRFDVEPTQKVRVTNDLLYGSFEAHFYEYTDPNIETQRKHDDWVSVLTVYNELLLVRRSSVTVLS
jgi:hypothetical protein